MDELEEELLSELAGSAPASPARDATPPPSLGLTPRITTPTASPLEAPRLLANRDVIGRDALKRVGATPEAAPRPRPAAGAQLASASKRPRSVRAATPTPEDLENLSELDKEFFGSLAPGEEDDEEEEEEDDDDDDDSSDSEDGPEVGSSGLDVDGGVEEI